MTSACDLVQLADSFPAGSVRKPVCVLNDEWMTPRSPASIVGASRFSGV
jgi:hypothetical protein